MPQLVKGGKYVFGISQLSAEYQIQIPPEAFSEYELGNTLSIVLIPGSKTSGGFAINSPVRLSQSKLYNLLKPLDYLEKFGTFGVPAYALKNISSRMVVWIPLNKEGRFLLTPELARVLGLEVNHKLVVVKGGYIGPGFVARGPIYEEAMCHPKLKIF
jgi:hypothetical protein